MSFRPFINTDFNILRITAELLWMNTGIHSITMSSSKPTFRAGLTISKSDRKNRKIGNATHGFDRGQHDLIMQISKKLRKLEKRYEVI